MGVDKERSMLSHYMAGEADTSIAERRVIGLNEETKRNGLIQLNIPPNGSNKQKLLSKKKSNYPGHRWVKHGNSYVTGRRASAARARGGRAPAAAAAAFRWELSLGAAICPLNIQHYSQIITLVNNEHSAHAIKEENFRRESEKNVIEKEANRNINKIRVQLSAACYRMPRSQLLRQSIGYSSGRGHSLLCSSPPLARYNNVNPRAGRAVESPATAD
ncbi:hypothetical protein EVAR_75403_1 [Eumeta japonica]|uniref:Uncharacterized protein n=1 Tax=Eumeta variegata TaxID=151549 RepID=A0A4C1TN12_EUMVA|nr:hypothetical protein EVAR_75403_1 [Eumeta japonica]